MNREYYAEVLDEIKRAQGKLSQALYADLDRLAGAESNSTKVKVQEAYERGVNEAFEAVNALREMRSLELEETIKACGFANITQAFEAENKVEVVKHIQQIIRDKRAKKPKVGDEVTYCSPVYEITGIVIETKPEKTELKIFDPIAMEIHTIQEVCVKKTGRHFSDTKRFLEIIKAMKGD